jgi:hypothetical protein
MSIIKQALFTTAMAMVLVVPRLAFATDRQACLDACRQDAEQCERERCGTDEPPADTDCGFLCGERYRDCKRQCPQ